MNVYFLGDVSDIMFYVLKLYNVGCIFLLDINLVTLTLLKIKKKKNLINEIILCQIKNLY